MAVFKRGWEKWHAHPHERRCMSETQNHLKAVNVVKKNVKVVSIPSLRPLRSSDGISNPIDLGPKEKPITNRRTEWCWQLHPLFTRCSNVSTRQRCHRFKSFARHPIPFGSLNQTFSLTPYSFLPAIFRKCLLPVALYTVRKAHLFLGRLNIIGWLDLPVVWWTWGWAQSSGSTIWRSELQSFTVILSSSCSPPWYYCKHASTSLRTHMRKCCIQCFGWFII